MGPETARRYLEAYRLIRDLLSESELARAIADGSVERLISDLASDDVLDPALRRLRLRLDQVLINTAESEFKALPRRFVEPVFSIINPRVIEAARQFDGLAIRSVVESVRETIVQEAIAGLEAGQNPRRVARRIRSSVGLSVNQAQAVENFRREIMSGDLNALRRVLGKGLIRRPDGSTITRPGHASGEGLSKAQLRRLEQLLREGKGVSAQQADIMVEAYRRRLLALNAEAQTKTQMLQAQKLGARLSWEDAIARGVVPRTALRRRWSAVAGPQGDGRNRPEHLALHGTVVGFDERYPNGQLVPGDSEYGCRCVERIYVDLNALRAVA